MRTSMTMSTGEPWGTSRELNPVCRTRHCRNLYLIELALRALALSVLAYLIAKKRLPGDIESSLHKYSLVPQEMVISRPQDIQQSLMRYALGPTKADLIYKWVFCH